MHAVLLTVHALIVLALIGVVLLQRSDGGALGLGGGGGGFMSSRGAANALTRTTSVLAALFFATSILLAITAGGAERDVDIIEDLTGERVTDPSAPVSTEDLLKTLGGSAVDQPSESAPPLLEAAPADTPSEAPENAAAADEATPEDTPQ